MNHIDQAFQAVDRRKFLPEDTRGHWEENRALPIGYGQTNSQPSTVAQMLEWLDVQAGMRVLDIGSGSGWTSALLAHLVGKAGKVYAVELIPELVEMGRENCLNAGIKNVEFYQATKQLGLSEQAPYDRILVSASADEFPERLLDQLAPGGKLVVPVEHTIYEAQKDEKGDVYRIGHGGYVFVPLIGDW